MKNILVTGKNSYIGNALKSFLEQWPEIYSVDFINMKDKHWKETSFARYDVIYHVAGIAHIKETAENSHLYYEVNRDLTIEIATKAKNDGVKQFIFLSTMNVYGMETGIITVDTKAIPSSSYGRSKLQAEENILPLMDGNFSICIIRPPMVYGKDCKGNFQSVINIVRNSPVFPFLDNKRSSIYIDNLSNFVKKCIDMNLKGLFFPQNREYMCTSKMALWIAEALGKNIINSQSLGFVVRCLQPFFNKSRKAFGNLIYKDLEKFDFDYCVVELEESVKKSV